ncbi:MAG: iron-containing alcohol dehydrogenase [Burkholderiaceae bacterium]
MTDPLPQGTHDYLAQDRVIWGRPAAQAVREECERRASERVFIIASKTLNRQTDAISRIRDELGGRAVTVFDECVEHTPRDSVIRAAHAARAHRPDLIVTVGGGTAIDTAKVMQIALARDLTEADQLGDWCLGVNRTAAGACQTSNPRPAARSS